VTCFPGYEWMSNGLGQNPCVVAGYLASDCAEKPWNVSPIPPGQGPYNPPGTTSAASLCRCNTVEYNLISGCSACQTGLVGTWQTWTQYCSSNIVTPGKYPKAVPAGTEIPTFAFWDTSISGLFTVDGGKKYRDDHTDIGSVNHTGAIVGGIIGGVSGLVLLAFALALMLSPSLRASLGISKPARATGAPAGGLELGNANHSSGDPGTYPASELVHLSPGTFPRLPQTSLCTNETYSGVKSA